MEDKSRAYIGKIIDVGVGFIDAANSVFGVNLFIDIGDDQIFQSGFSGLAFADYVYQDDGSINTFRLTETFAKMVDLLKMFNVKTFGELVGKIIKVTDVYDDGTLYKFDAPVMRKQIFVKTNPLCVSDESGIPKVRPCEIDVLFEHPCRKDGCKVDCQKCRETYWNALV